MTEDRDLLRQRLNAMSPEERAALNKVIKDRAAEGQERCRKVSPTALKRFKEKTEDYPLKGTAAFLHPHRDRLRKFVVHVYESGNDEHDLTDLNILRFMWGDESLTHPQAQKLLSIAVAWLRQLELVCSVRLSRQLNSPYGATKRERPLTLSWIKTNLIKPLPTQFQGATSVIPVHRTSTNPPMKAG